jgi:dTDP-4-amino-4,6-dideoxygalactose transaminase
MRIEWVPSKPVSHDRVRELLQPSIDKNQLTNGGPCVRRLERYIREKLEINSDRGVVCVTNGTVALDVIARAFDILDKKDNQWVTSSFTFPSSAQVKGGGCTTIVDIDRDGGPDLADPTIKEADGLFVTTVFGNLVDVKKYEAFGRENGVRIVFDNAATPFSFFEGENSLNRGDASMVSFHHTKTLGFSEGSACVVSRELEPVVRKLINFGISNTDVNPAWSPLGTNGKMSDVSAAYILAFIEENLDRTVKHHRMLYEALTDRLKRFGPTDRVRMFPNFSSETPVAPCLCLIFRDKNTDRLVDMFTNCSVYTRRYYTPLDSSRCKNSVRLHNHIICLPCHVEVSLETLDEYVEVIGNFLES